MATMRVRIDIEYKPETHRYCPVVYDADTEALLFVVMALKSASEAEQFARSEIRKRFPGVQIQCEQSELGTGD